MNSSAEGRTSSQVSNEKKQQKRFSLIRDSNLPKVKQERVFHAFHDCKLSRSQYRQLVHLLQDTGENHSSISSQIGTEDNSEPEVKLEKSTDVELSVEDMKTEIVEDSEVVENQNFNALDMFPSDSLVNGYEDFGHGRKISKELTWNRNEAEEIFLRPKVLLFDSNSFSYKARWPSCYGSAAMAEAIQRARYCKVKCETIVREDAQEEEETEVAENCDYKVKGDHQADHNAPQRNHDKNEKNEKNDWTYLTSEEKAIEEEYLQYNRSICQQSFNCMLCKTKSINLSEILIHRWEHYKSIMTYEEYIHGLEIYPYGFQKPAPKITDAEENLIPTSFQETYYGENGESGEMVQMMIIEDIPPSYAMEVTVTTDQS